MSNRSFIAITVLALLAVGCGGGASGNCNNQCAAGKTEGCIASDTDCAMYCTGVDMQVAALRANAGTAGCRSQFDAFYACTSTGSICDTSTRCSAEETALMTCGAEFCTANPTHAICTGP
ncbi:MAG: hypothetical protein IT378_12645 [Sandaracinaceae bacterium]|nr:hypothetical protein [Sandaracinaceae bacterium]